MTFSFYERFAAKSGDTQDIKSRKIAVFLLAMSCSLAGLLWSGIYAVVFGAVLATFLPSLFTIIVGSSLVISHLTKNHRISIYAQIVSILVITTTIQWTIGGLFDSGLVLLWAILAPLGALMFFSLKRSLPWFVLFFLALAITVSFDGYFADNALDVDDNLRRFFVAMNIGGSSAIVLLFAGYFVTAAVRERARADELLLNVLPAEIAESLKASNETIAEQHESISVLFADIEGSTPLFADLEPIEVVDWLNEVFSVLDDHVERHGLEKLRTMGDGYMVGAGVPTSRSDHATALVDCSLGMIETLQKLQPRNGHRIRFRFGINSGPVVAGVIGKSKFHYDVWGDTVNVAGRMESHGIVDRIHISKNTYDLVKDEFECVAQGTVSIKGKGGMETWLVVGRKTG
jgi:guanylate cyclase